MNKYLTLLAGGIGKRMGADKAKQYIDIEGKEILQYTLEAFFRYADFQKIVVALPDLDAAIIEKYNITYPSQNLVFVQGGASRFQSSKNALDQIPDEYGIVFIHDAARPFVTNEMLQRLEVKAKETGNAIPAVPIISSLRRINGENSEIINRDKIRAIQTPQVFEVMEIKKAMAQDESDSFTDDASVLESWGKKVNLVEGDFENIKITTPDDLDYAKFIIGKREL